MSNIKISELPVGTTPLVGTEEIPIVQGGQTVKVTASDIAGGGQDLQSVLDNGFTADNVGIVLQDTGGSYGISYFNLGQSQFTNFDGTKYITIDAYSGGTCSININSGASSQAFYDAQNARFLSNVDGETSYQHNYIFRGNIGLTTYNRIHLQPSSIQTLYYATGVENLMGLSLAYDIQDYRFGDFNGANNSTYIQVDDSAGIMVFNMGGAEFHYTQELRYSDSGSGALLSASSGGSSGQHLKININGTNYKIALSNP